MGVFRRQVPPELGPVFGFLDEITRVAGERAGNHEILGKQQILVELVSLGKAAKPYLRGELPTLYIRTLVLLQSGAGVPLVVVNASLKALRAALRRVSERQVKRVSSGLNAK
jgi:hypothetical protein